MIRILLFSILSFSFISSDEHAIYLSTIMMDIDETEIQLEIRVFEDDLRDALRNEFKMIIDTSSSNFIDYTHAYFNNHFKLSLQNKEIRFQNAQITRVGDSYRYLANYKGMRPIGGISLEVDYFLELFPVQQNILHLQKGQKKWYHIFKSGSRQYVINQLD